MGYAMKLIDSFFARKKALEVPKLNSALFHPLSRFTNKSFQRDLCVSDSNGQLFLRASTFFCISLFAIYLQDSCIQTYRKQVRADSFLLHADSPTKRETQTKTSQKLAADVVVCCSGLLVWICPFRTLRSLTALEQVHHWLHH